ncbi:hypothetical protein OG777_08685 [Micromonospora peucetia]|uniref:hypothetical protein n=1 Tax=Micromonospora peucetia TaxID=47871 RepID=UPI001FDF8F67|nr:hypothetical protein [Micromonospora peucetia]MCX4387003.1 hypothetical protein [Micromonospora peucetia]
MFRRLRETARENRRQQDLRAKSKNPDGCCDCCDLGLFSTLLMVGSATAAATHAPVLDRGRPDGRRAGASLPSRGGPWHPRSGALTRPPRA